MRIAAGADHRGYALKQKIIDHLTQEGHEVTDMGATSPERCDFPDFAFPVAQSVACGDHDRGVLICGSGIGMSIAANKVPGIRAAFCPTDEIAFYSRAHNDANVLVLAGDFTTDDQARAILTKWLDTPFQGGRYARRLEKIVAFEEQH